ncbi:DsbA family protein [Comamonas sp. GB3 AK4-5]|uniref:DsbA family protein n=1 Tax=Comamonas sp. GB3 AK4-5 TaxID=3231487 RepID=UPI00351F59DE
MTVPTVRYIGDPMCSWCWGISPALQALAAYCKDHHIDFSVHVGGLRAGGGDAWNAPFKAFLRHEWETIQRVTGQPFGFTLLDEAAFHYDTEPACRAVVAMSQLLAERKDASQAVLAFFSGIQKQFYVDGADPKQAAFYRPLCTQAGVPYAEFLQHFLSPQAQAATLEEFQRCRSWGIRGFPSILLDRGGEMRLLASGHTTGTALMEKLESLLGDATATS